jgi:hypothetical protein
VTVGRTQSTEYQRMRGRGTDELGLVSLGVFLLLIGYIWLTVPTIWEEVGRFIRDLKPIYYDSYIVFFEPRTVHVVLYTAAATFCLLFAVWRFVLMAIRIVVKSYPTRIVKELTGGLFYVGAAILFQRLASAELAFAHFIPLVLILGGAVLVARGIFNAVVSRPVAPSRPPPPPPPSTAPPVTPPSSS